MITTLATLAAVCLLSLALILVIPYFAATKVLMGFLPQDVREAAKAHPDPSFGRLMIGYLLTALAAAGFAGVVFFSARTVSGADTGSGCCSGGTCCLCTATRCSIFWCRTSTS